MFSIDASMIAAGYLGSEATTFKFPIFVLGCVLFMIMVTFWYKTKVDLVGPLTGSKLMTRRLMMLTLTSWSFYPIVWVLEESHLLSVEATIISHFVLSAFAKVAFGGLLAFFRMKLMRVMHVERIQIDSTIVDSTVIVKARSKTFVEELM